MFGSNIKHLAFLEKGRGLGKGKSPTFIGNRACKKELLQEFLQQLRSITENTDQSLMDFLPMAFNGLEIVILSISSSL